MIRVLEVVGRPAIGITNRSSSRATASSCRIAAPSASSPTTPTRRQCAPMRGDVGGDVGRAAQRRMALADGDHRHRRLGGEPLGVAHEIAVEHDVAHHDDPALFIRSMRWSTRSRVSGGGGGLIGALPAAQAQRGLEPALEAIHRAALLMVGVHDVVQSRVGAEVERALPAAHAHRRPVGALHHADEELRESPASAGGGGKGVVDLALALAQHGELGRQQPARRRPGRGQERELVHVGEVAAEPDAGIGEVLERIEGAEGEAGGLGVERAPAERAAERARSRQGEGPAVG